MKACLYMKRILLFLISCLCLAMEVMGNSGNSSAASFRPKVINIGALFTLNSIIGKSAGPSLIAAIHDVNSDSSILNGTKLNLIVQDTDCSGFLGTVEAYGEMGMEDVDAAAVELARLVSFQLVDGSFLVELN